MKRKKVIGVDFDDVIVSTNHTLALWHNRHYGTSYMSGEISDWDLTCVWNCSRAEMYRRIHEFYNSTEHTTILPVRGAVEALVTMRTKQTHIITARPKDFSAITLALANQHIPFMSEKFNFTNSIAMGDNPSHSKSDICIELGVEIFIEDSIDFARGVASVGIPVLLFDRPWNQTNNLPANIQRVYSWDEIVSLLC